MRIGQLLEAKQQNGLPSLESAAKLNTSDAVLQNLLGLAHMRRSNFETARIHFQRACNIAPNMPDPHANLAIAILKSSQRHNLNKNQIAAEQEAAQKELGIAKSQSGNHPKFNQTNH
jgi:Flp pilus assembly protein TadD